MAGWFYPPPMPLFPQPQAVITQQSAATQFFQTQAQVPSPVARTWEVAFAPLQHLVPAPIFPPPQTQDTTFLMNPYQAALYAAQAVWQVPLAIVVFGPGAPPQPTFSQVLPVPENTAFEWFISNPAVPSLPQTLSPVQNFPLPPSYPYLISLAQRDLPISIASFKKLGEAPPAIELEPVQPFIGNVGALVLPTPANSMATRTIINATWTVPKPRAQGAPPVPPHSRTGTTLTISTAMLPITITITL